MRDDDYSRCLEDETDGLCDIGDFFQQHEVPVELNIPEFAELTQLMKENVEVGRALLGLHCIALLVGGVTILSYLIWG